MRTERSPEVRTMTTVIPDRTNARSLLSEGLFDRLCHRVTLDEGADRAFAERIID